MENLNKENFFNEMAEKYPKGMQAFCDWIDGYKAAIGWKKLFNEPEDPKEPVLFITGEMKVFGEISKTGNVLVVDDKNQQPTITYLNPILAPKFHDIPFEMQVGIVFKFMKYVNYEPTSFNIDIIKLDLQDIFLTLNK